MQNQEDPFRDVEGLALALELLAIDANKVLRDKWWSRTRTLRKLTNLARRLKGWPERHHPQEFVVADYVKMSTAEPGAKGARESDAERDGTVMVDEFVEFSRNDDVQTIPRVIALYLPQFHPFEENDKFWGKGFTEWTNVGKARTYFGRHYQPRTPIHLGYYDLRLPEVMEEQAKLARNYGISGFAYYFYWFSGKTPMETPLKAMLANANVDMPFFLIWANENWTRKWDGLDDEILIQQEHSAKDSEKFLEHIVDYLQDGRYIKVNGRPVLGLYRPDLIPDLRKTIARWNSAVREHGFEGLHILACNSFGNDYSDHAEISQALEFPPHGLLGARDVTDEVGDLATNFLGRIYSYGDTVAGQISRKERNATFSPTVMLDWDNTPRKQNRGDIFWGFSNNMFGRWLSSSLERVIKSPTFDSDRAFVFVNAWNEWAEGTYLEPDHRRGYAALTTVRRTLEDFRAEALPFWRPIYPDGKSSTTAVIAHVHYPATIPLMRKAVENLSKTSLDLFFTCTSLRVAEELAHHFPGAVVELVDNRGRDIRPFLDVLRKLAPLDYENVLKIHGKLSVHRADGAAWGRSLVEGLARPEVLDWFALQPHVGIATLESDWLELNDERANSNRRTMSALMSRLGIHEWPANFVAGSMFWFRPQAMTDLLLIDSAEFEPESGALDGTCAHSIERLFASVAGKAGFEVATIPEWDSGRGDRISSITS